MRLPAAIAGVLLLNCSPVALADGTRAEPGLWWQAWSWDPLVLLSLAMLAMLYGRGLVRLWRKAGMGQTVSRWQAASFVGALVVVFIALLSPLDALSME